MQSNQNISCYRLWGHENILTFSSSTFWLWNYELRILTQSVHSSLVDQVGQILKVRHITDNKSRVWKAEVEGLHQMEFNRAVIVVIGKCKVCKVFSWVHKVREARSVAGARIGRVGIVVWVGVEEEVVKQQDLEHLIEVLIPVDSLK